MKEFSASKNGPLHEQAWLKDLIKQTLKNMIDQNKQQLKINIDKLEKERSPLHKEFITHSKELLGKLESQFLTNKASTIKTIKRQSR